MTDTALGFSSNVAVGVTTIRPLSDCRPHPDNIRKHNLPAIARSLSTHGQRTPVVVQSSSGYIVKGNGTWEAAKMLGWTECLQSWQDLDDGQALAYLYADNKTSDLAKYDRDRTIAGLRKMMDGPGLFDSLWEIDELEDLEAEAGQVKTTNFAEFKGGYADEGAEADERAAKSAEPKQKMREVPIVLTLADHAAFVERIKNLQRAYGTSGTIATIVEAVRRAAEAPVEEKSTVRQSILRELRDYFLTAGRDSWTVAQIAAFFQGQMAPTAPELPPVTPDPVPGQASLDDLL